MAKSDFQGAANSAKFAIGDPSMPVSHFNTLSRTDQRAHLEKLTIAAPIADRSFPSAGASTAGETKPAKRQLGSTARPEIPHVEIDPEGLSVNLTSKQKSENAAARASQEAYDKAHPSQKWSSKGPSARAPKGPSPVATERKAISDKIKARHENLLGGSEEESAAGTGKTTDAIGLIRDLANKIDTFHSAAPDLVAREAKVHEDRAAELGVGTPEGQVHMEHAGNLRRALEMHIKGLRTARGNTRPDPTSSNLVEVRSRTAGAEKTMKGSGSALEATAVANVDVRGAAKTLTNTIKGMARTPLGKLGILPDINKGHLKDLAAVSGSLNVPKVDYSKSEPDVHPEAGPSKPGHVWVGTTGGLTPTLRQVPVHPDTLTEILNTPRNGRQRTKQDPDYVKVANAIKEAKRASGGSGTGVYKGRDAAGLPVKMEEVISTTDGAPTPVENIPKSRRVTGSGGKAVPGAAMRPVRGGPQAEALTQEQKDTIAANREANRQRVKDRIAATESPTVTGVTAYKGKKSFKKPKTMGEVKKEAK